MMGGWVTTTPINHACRLATPTAGDVQEAPDLPQSSIMQRARQLAASRADMKRCIDLCYRLLERFQPPGSDRNFFDFQKCLNACLGVNR